MLYVCFVDLEKAFDRVPRKVAECAVRKRGVPEAVMSLMKARKQELELGKSCLRSLR